MKIIAIAALVSACSYDPSFGDCLVACGTALECPQGLACGAGGFCRAPDSESSCSDPGKTDSDPDDVDGDGVMNVDDNCPTIKNSDQANEDGDRFGDACDPCPPFADPPVLDDPDGDGVSGACDPFPTLPGDRIALFEGFALPSLPHEWSSVGDWSFSQGDAVITEGDARASLFVTRTTTARQTVATQFVVGGLSGTDQQIGTMQLADTSRDVECVLDHVRPTQDFIEIANVVGGAIQIVEATMAPPFERTTVTFSHRRVGTQHVCGDGPATTTGVTPFVAGPLDLGVVTRSVSARVKWVLVVESSQ